VLSLKDTLASLQAQGMQVLTRQVETVVVPPLPGPPPRPPEAGKPGTPRTRVVTVEEQSQMDLSGDAAGRVLDELKAKLAAGQGIELSLTWRLQRRETE
jgi:hypothetical protein